MTITEIEILIMKNNMSIKKGKKQVYKVGSTVRVVEHELEDGRHIGKVGLLGKIFEDGTYSVYGDWGHALATEIELVSPVKPKQKPKKPITLAVIPNGKGEYIVGHVASKPLKPKKSIKKTYKKDEEIEAPKTYKYLWMCDNCRKMDYVHIPLGTTVEDFIEKGFICKFCGC